MMCYGMMQCSERQKCHFRASNFKNFPGGMPQDPPSYAGPRILLQSDFKLNPLLNFFRKTILIEKNIRSHDVLSGLHSIKFLEILNSNKTPNTFFTYQLKINFKSLNFVRKPFLMCFKIRTSLGLKYLNFRIFSCIVHRKYPSNVH